MAKKRTLRVETSDSEETEPQEEDKARESTLKEWLRGTYSKYWYFVICLFVDISVALELGRAIGYPWSYFLPLVIVGLMILLEWRLYLRIWSKNRKAETDES